MTTDCWTLRGMDAIKAAERGEAITLCKYQDPTEGPRVGLTVSEARAVAHEDPGLIYARPSTAVPA